MKRLLIVATLALAIAAWAIVRTIRVQPDCSLSHRRQSPPRLNNRRHHLRLRRRPHACCSPSPSDSPNSNAAEVPDFRRHIEPLFVRLGCNGRACHGSFQGRGGFRLSLFGYDAETDHQTLLSSTDGKVNLKHPDQSLILLKPTLAIDHEGGLR